MRELENEGMSSQPEAAASGLIKISVPKLPPPRLNSSEPPGYTKYGDQLSVI
ncbi:MAG: hypothetical protein ACI81P_003106 [Neolewinella sp.]|jgi:hypothetical protein